MNGGRTNPGRHSENYNTVKYTPLMLGNYRGTNKYTTVGYEVFTAATMKMWRRVFIIFILSDCTLS
jgi:hypothetical protein